jgi:hypothetical protein
MAKTPHFTNMTFPPGRLVRGSLYVPQTKDMSGNLLTIKTGPNVGQPTVKYWFAVAIAKDGTGQHWAYSPWGKKVFELGAAAFPQFYNLPLFAWKVVDGDSAEIKTAGAKAPKDNEGYPGHWIVSFSSTYPPKICDAKGQNVIAEVDAVVPGYFVQVNASIDSNQQPTKPGIFMNGNVVSLQGFGPVIYQGADTTSMGFGEAPLPPGASAVPIGQMPGAMPPGMPPGAGAPPPTPGGYPAPGPAPAVGAMPPPGQPVYTAPAAAPPPTAVAPHPGFVTNVAAMPPPGAMPGAGAPPPPPGAVPAAAPGPVMTATAVDTYQGYRSKGWTDDQLRQYGLMV